MRANGVSEKEFGLRHRNERRPDKHNVAASTRAPELFDLIRHISTGQTDCLRLRIYNDGSGAIEKARGWDDDEPELYEFGSYQEFEKAVKNLS